MASPQWKNFQPSAQESAMSSYQQTSTTFTKTSNSNHDIDSNNHNNSPNGNAGNLRETGIVEKLLHSYGFIQCCERQARLFFHYSQYSGNIEHLKLGDPVEFEMTYDRRTGKPIASSVLRIAPEAGEVLSEERVSGFITTEIKDDMEGRVAYESRGECFFLPYSRDDLEGNIDLHPHDKVTFFIATDKKTGNLRARNIQHEKPVPDRHQGVVCAVKDTFGFIERADVVKEIFFHSSECEEFKNLNPGEDVEFSIHTRNNKEVAVNIIPLPSGTVVFEDIGTDNLMGQITKALERTKTPGDPLPARIECQHEDGSVIEYPFGERDTKVEYTLQSGDWVQFNVATDRRDGLQRATNIELILDTFEHNKEKREQGVVSTMKDSFGFIRYGNRDTRLYFRLSEIMNWDKTIKQQDEVEFTVAQDPVSQGRFHAIRIQVLPAGTVAFDLSTLNSGKHSDHEEDKNSLSGIIEKAASSPWSSKSPLKGSNRIQTKLGEDDNESVTEKDADDGIISFYRDDVKEKISYTARNCQGRNLPHVGDKVGFSISSKNGEIPHALNVRVVSSKTRNGFRYSLRGFIAALKDSFGFIETEEHEREVFFHYSVFDGNTSSLEVGQEVEYGLTHKGNKLSAECVRKLPSGSIIPEEMLPEILNGIVVSPLRCFNPEQENYAGKIRLTTDDAPEDEEEKELPEYEFGITSLTDKHEFLQKGDVVQFQIGVTSKDIRRAVNIKSIRTRVQAVVETIKGQFGFLSYEAEEGKKLFFHMSEVKDGTLLQPGDKVEFVVLHHQGTGKYSACSVVKIGENQPVQRPERLISRLRTLTTEDGSGPRLIIERHPKGPDGTEGFKFLRDTIDDAFCFNGDAITDSCVATFNGDQETPLVDHLIDQ